MNRFSRERIEEWYLEGMVKQNQPAMRRSGRSYIVRYLQLKLAQAFPSEIVWTTPVGAIIGGRNEGKRHPPPCLLIYLSS